MTVSTEQEQAKTFFVISAEDGDLACSVLQMRFELTDPTRLFALIPDAHIDDPHRTSPHYPLDDHAWRRIVRTFDVPFDTAGLAGRDIEVWVWQAREHSTIPYLVHTGCELVLLLDGRKKLARLGNLYPPMSFSGEHAYDRYAAAGQLHREEVLDPFDKPHRDWLGHRTVYYTIPGEEWRIPAMKLLNEAATKSGGWNEIYERLEGMLFGYEDWQNDWWIENGKRLGFSFFGTSLCCAVDEAGLIWFESAGRKALPPVEADHLTLSLFQPDSSGQPLDLLAEHEGAVAVLRFNIPGRVLLDRGWRGGGPWHIPASEISNLNRVIRGSIDILLKAGT